MLATPPDRPFRTGDWVVEPETLELRRLDGSECHRLAPQVMDVLVLLAQRSGRVVSRDELMRIVWEDRAVTDDALTVTIYELRKVLGDSSKSPAYLETVKRRGYRWLQASSELAGNPAPSKGSPARGSVPKTKVGRAVRRHAGPLLLLVSLCLTAGWALGRLSSETRSEPPFLAVRALSVEKSPTPVQPSLAEDLAEGLIDQLSLIPQLRVMAHASARLLDEQRLADSRAHGTVDIVLEGTLQRRLEQLQLELSLVEHGKDGVGRALWKQTFEGTLPELEQLQRDIANAVARALGQAPPFAAPTGTSDSLPIPDTARELYWQGRLELAKKDRAGLAKAEQLLENAVVTSPHFADALARLADVHLNQAFFGPPGEREPRVERARVLLGRAITLDPRHAFAHELLAMLHITADWDIAAAERILTTTIQMHPGRAQSRDRYGQLLAVKGDLAASEAQMSLAWHLDPYVERRRIDLAWFLLRGEKNRAALELLSPPGRWQGIQAQAWHIRATALERLGQPEQAFASLLNLLVGLDQESESTEPYRQAFAAGGLPEVYRSWLDREGDRIASSVQVLIRARLGQWQQAQATIDQMYAQRDPMLLWVQHEPELQPLRRRGAFSRLNGQAGKKSKLPQHPSSLTSHPSWILNPGQAESQP